MVRLTGFLEAELSLSGCVIWHKGEARWRSRLLRPIEHYRRGPFLRSGGGITMLNAETSERRESGEISSLARFELQLPIPSTVTFVWQTHFQEVDRDLPSPWFWNLTMYVSRPTPNRIFGLIGFHVRDPVFDQKIDTALHDEDLSEGEEERALVTLDDVLDRVWQLPFIGTAFLALASDPLTIHFLPIIRDEPQERPSPHFGVLQSGRWERSSRVFGADSLIRIDRSQPDRLAISMSLAIVVPVSNRLAQFEGMRRAMKDAYAKTEVKQHG